jgi:catechol 2,3-dioxygenase-like lactoylglutathione lyase family enzyme
MIALSDETSEPAAPPAPYGFRGIAVPVRDAAEARQFYVGVLGGELLTEEPDYAKVAFGPFIIELAKQNKGSTPPEAEYPHYAFTVGPEEFVVAKRRLDECGIPTHEPWGRQGRTAALMYFRDPSGNQFELYSEAGAPLPLRIGARAGGDYVVPFASLNYDRLPQAARQASGAPKTLSAGFNHMTLPVRDMHEGTRFLVNTLGGRVKFERPDHITVYVGGAEIGQSRAPHGWTLPDAEFPHYTLLARAEDLLPIKQQLQSFHVPVSDVWTRNGSDACFYVRDPSGNLYELYAESGFNGASRRKPDVRALNYSTWNDPAT